MSLTASRTSHSGRSKLDLTGAVRFLLANAIGPDRLELHTSRSKMGPLLLHEPSTSTAVMGHLGFT